MCLACPAEAAGPALEAAPAGRGAVAARQARWAARAQMALSLFFATVLVVHLPKLLGAVWVMRSSVERKRHGGVLNVVGGVTFECLLSVLIAPVLMVTQTAAVVGILAGRDAGWAAQRRVTPRASAIEFLAQHRWHMAWGVLAGR